MDKKEELLNTKKKKDNSENKKEKRKVEKERCKDDSCVSEGTKENSNTTRKGILLNKLSSSDTNISKKSTLSKIFNWDPWTKIRRKNKKNKNGNEFVEMKMDYDSSDSSAYNIATYSYRELSDPHEYRGLGVIHEQYRGEPHHTKQVKFQTDVRVIHFDSDTILGDTVEPLKKEQDQQLRNIQLRKEKAEEALDMMRTKSKKSMSNYMSAWRKK